MGTTGPTPPQRTIGWNEFRVSCFESARRSPYEEFRQGGSGKNSGPSDLQGMKAGLATVGRLGQALKEVEFRCGVGGEAVAAGSSREAGGRPCPQERGID